MQPPPPPDEPGSTPRARDIYGRKPTSRSRGRTQQRIMDLQHAPHELPGAEELVAGAPPGSIAAAIVSFHQGWVAGQPVTSSRAYERALVLLLKDLAACGPPPAAPVGQLTGDRLGQHLHWRVANGLAHAAELQRAPVHLARLGDWIDEQYGTALRVTREQLRARMARSLEQ